MNLGVRGKVREKEKREKVKRERVKRKREVGGKKREKVIMEKGRLYMYCHKDFF